jgi:pimeloyl-ACP methyl ester carboxylesterase
MENSPPQSGTRRLRIVLRKYDALLKILILLAVVLASGYLLQSKLIYLPTRYSTADLVQAADQRALALWPAEDRGYRGLVTAGSGGGRGTVVVFHGNAGSAVHRLHYVAALERLGFKVVLAEYPGYGAREGRPSERALVAEAKATIRLAERDFGGPLYLWGESLGSGVAAAAAGDASLPVEGLVLVTPFASLPEVAQSVYWFLPVKWLICEQYNNVENLRGFEKPVAVLVAGKDELIPRKQAQALYDSLATEKRMWVFEGAGHNTWPASPEEAWWREVADFTTGEGMSD